MTAKKWRGEVWSNNKLVSEEDELPLRDHPREAYEDAVEWAVVNRQNFARVMCYGVNVENDADFFDLESFHSLTLEADEAQVGMAGVVAFTVQGRQIMAIDEDGNLVPLRLVGGLNHAESRYLHPASEEEAWDWAAELAHECWREFVRDEKK